MSSIASQGYLRRWSIAACWLLVSTGGASLHAAIIWNEAVNGPLSTNNLAPTDLSTLAIGTSTVSGSVTNQETPANVDVFRFVVPVGSRLNGIVLQQYLSGDGLAFIALDSGPTFPYSRQQLRAGVDESQFIGGSTFGYANASIGTDLLSPSYIGGRFIGTQPTPEQTTAVPYDSLPSGQYSVYIQQQGGLTQYSLDFVVAAVPEPTSSMLILVAGFLVLRREDKRAIL